MADITITAASVQGGSGEKVYGTAGATITAGQVVYLDPDGTYKLADCNSATAAVRSPLGIALNGGATGQTIGVIKSGNVTPGATLTVGLDYWLSGTAGGIRPSADNTTGDYPVFLGFATSATVLKLSIVEATVAKP